MIETVFRSEDLPAADRFDHVRELVSLAPMPMDVTSDHKAGFWLYQRDLHFDAVRVWTLTLQPMTFRRTTELIEKSDPQTYNISLLLHGTMRRTWGPHEVTYRPYDLYIGDSSQPFELWAHSTSSLISCMGIEIPKRSLPLPRHRADQVIGRPTSGQEGVGALLARFLTHLTADTTSYLPIDDPHLGVVATDLVSALFAHLLNADHRPPAEIHQRTLVLHIQTFIQQHLADPHLTPRAIAAAHHISLSYLHRLFRNEQFTVAAWIRHQRMEHARRDLADRALHATPIHAIAAQWGFTRPADFTRAFRTTYGIPPKDYRRQALNAHE